MAFTRRVIKLFLMIILMVSVSYLVTSYINNKTPQEAPPITTKPKKELSPNVIIIKDHINAKTYKKFISAYNKTNKKKDINIIIHSQGGELMVITAICDCILNHKGPGKIIGIIPFYAFSGGTEIALCCDELLMSPYSLLSPCDVLISVNKEVGYTSCPYIANVITEKETNNINLDENWAIANIKAQKYIDLSKKFITGLCKMRNYDENKIYEELFSGKYTHDTSFTTQQIIDMNLGLKITIIENIDKSKYYKSFFV
jgi:membrane-bound ClpP family serine protease